VSGYVDLDYPPQGGPFGVFLAVKEVGSRGGCAGLGALEPLEDAEKLCLLVSHPMRDLVEEVVGNAVHKGQR
jgi:hypothetical protein